MKRSSYIGAFVLFALTAATAFSVRSSRRRSYVCPHPLKSLKRSLLLNRRKLPIFFAKSSPARKIYIERHK
jgi:hypothetical protein